MTVTKDYVTLEEFASGHGADPDTGHWKIIFHPDGMYIVDDAGNEIGPLGGDSVLVQRVEATPNTTHSSITTALPVDDTIPQSGEGGEVITVTITPTSAMNRLVIRAKFMGTSNTALLTVIALFQDAIADALAVAYQISTADGLMSVDLVYEMAAGTTSATTFKLRAGNNSGATTYVNGTSAGRRFGGRSACRLSVEEIAV